jgi:hypothetical protein
MNMIVQEGFIELILDKGARTKQCRRRSNIIVSRMPKYHVPQRGLMVRQMHHMGCLAFGAQFRHLVHALDIRVASERGVEKQDAQVALPVEKIDLLDLGHERRPARQAQPALTVPHDNTTACPTNGFNTRVI